METAVPNKTKSKRGKRANYSTDWFLKRVNDEITRDCSNFGFLPLKLLLTERLQPSE